MNHPSKAALIALAILALTLGALTSPALAAGSASGAGPTAAGTPPASPGTTGAGWCGGGMWNGTGSWGGTGMWGTGSGVHWLRDNPAAMQAWLQLRADHVKAMQTWYDTYKADLTTPAAQQALHDLWTTLWNDMKSFYEQYANGATWTCPSDGMWGGWDMGGMMGAHHWDASHMWGNGYGAEWMTGHAAGLGQWLGLRARQTADVTTWMQKHHGALRSTGATKALNHMTAHHRAQIRSFFKQRHLTTSSAMMRYGAGGWMGLGGMWGGWGW